MYFPMHLRVLLQMGRKSFFCHWQSQGVGAEQKEKWKEKQNKKPDKGSLVVAVVSSSFWKLEPLRTNSRCLVLQLWNGLNLFSSSLLKPLHFSINYRNDGNYSVSMIWYLTKGILPSLKAFASGPAQQTAIIALVRKIPQRSILAASQAIHESWIRKEIKLYRIPFCSRERSLIPLLQKTSFQESWLFRYQWRWLAWRSGRLSKSGYLNDAKGKLVLKFKGDFRKSQQHQHLHGIHNSLLLYQPE